jgi:membrane-bound lytic murein transglycosylase D
MIQAVFKTHGLPAELAWVAMIESGFNPVAVSRAGAKGLWQFMEETARRYGLRVDPWVDERLDPEKSTVAAAMYLRDLFGQFGSWLLAKAAYNAGELKVSQALRRSQTNDFWALTRGRLLREETKRFVPAILAATLIGLNPEQYGFEVSPEPPLAYDLVMVRPLADLKRLAVSAGLPPADLTRLNPELRRGVTPPGTVYPLKVPAGGGAAVQRVAEEPRALQAKAAVHVVKPRETLGAIARRHGVSIADLVHWNRLADSSRIFPGDRLVVSEPR